MREIKNMNNEVKENLYQIAINMDLSQEKYSNINSLYNKIVRLSLKNLTQNNKKNVFKIRINGIKGSILEDNCLYLVSKLDKKPNKLNIPSFELDSFNYSMVLYCEYEG